jgi:hypothetical protein
MVAFVIWVMAFYTAGPELVPVIVWLLVPIEVLSVGFLIGGGALSLYGWISFFAGRKAKPNGSSGTP